MPARIFPACSFRRHFAEQGVAFSRANFEAHVTQGRHTGEVLVMWSKANHDHFAQFFSYSSTLSLVTPVEGAKSIFFPGSRPSRTLPTSRSTHWLPK